MKDLVGREQAAKILGVTKTMIDIYRGRGDLNPVPTTDFRTYFLRSEVLAFKRTRKKTRAAKRREQAKKKAQQTNQNSHENNNS